MLVENGLTQMREFLYLAEGIDASLIETIDETYKEENVEKEASPIIADLSDLVLRLRAFMEATSAGDHALGVEEGMQRAADMVENLVKRHLEGHLVG